ncbi:MAG: hypothetical protein NVV57_05790 [Demequina sp.]|nr:hypothetical protein [Demequina sp.]
MNATDPETKAAHALIVQNAKGTINKPQGTNCWYMGTTCRAIDIWNTTMPFTHINVGQAVGYNRLLAVLNTPEIHVESVLESVGATFGITANEFFFGDIERCVGGDRGSCAWAVVGIAPGVGKLPKLGKAVEVATGASKFGELTHAAEGIAPYSTQRLVTAGHGGEIQAHHLIEKRFADVMGGNTSDWASIVVTRSEHQAFTNAWRQAIPYGTRNVTPAMVNNAARDIYGYYPEVGQALGVG